MKFKFRVLSGPQEKYTDIEGKHNEKFEKIFKKIEKALKYKGQLWEEYQVHTANLIEGTRKVEASPTIIKDSDTPDSLKMTQKKGDPPILLLLRPKGLPLGSSPQHSKRALSRSQPAVERVKEASLAAEENKKEIPAPSSAEKDAAPQKTEKVPSSTKTPEAIAPEGTPRTQIESSYRDRLTALYMKYAPEKVSSVDDMLKQFEGQEETAFKQLIKLYGPEPNPDELPGKPKDEIAVPEDDAVSTSSSSSSSLKIDIVNDGYSYHDRLYAIYKVHDPEKTSQVDAVLQKYPGREEKIIQELVKKYGKEPVIGVDVQLENKGRTYKERLTAMYQTYNPEKLPKVDGTLKKFKGKEEEVIQQLVEKYGPEPSPNAPQNNKPIPGANEKVDAKGIEPIANESSFKEKVTEILAKYDPDSMYMVEPLLEAYEGREEDLIVRLMYKYNNEEGNREDSEKESDSGDSEDDDNAEKAGETSEVAIVPVLRKQQTVDLATQEAKTVTQIDSNWLRESPHVSQSSTPPPQVTNAADPDSVPPPVVITTEPTSPASSVDADDVEPKGANGKRDAFPETADEGELADVEDGASRQNLSSAQIGEDSGIRPTEPNRFKDEPNLTTDSEGGSTVNPPRKARQERVIISVPVGTQVKIPSHETGTMTDVPRSKAKLNQRTADLVSEQLAKKNSAQLGRRALSLWMAKHYHRKAEELLESGALWTRGDSGTAQMNDSIQPRYVVTNLAGHLRGSPSSSSELPDILVSGLRDVIDALKQCLNASVVEVNDDKDKEMVDKFIAEWSSEKDLCPVRCSDKLVLVLKQAARFLRQVEDIMAISKRQNRQIVELTEEIRAERQRNPINAVGVRSGGGLTPRDLDTKQIQQLTAENQKLREELERVYTEVAYHKNRESKPTSPAVSPRGKGPSKAPAHIRLHRDSDHQMEKLNPRDKDAHIAKLEQELAKSRTALNRQKEKNEDLRQQLVESESARRRSRHDILRAASNRGSPVSRRRSRSQPCELSISPIPNLRASGYADQSPKQSTVSRGANTTSATPSSTHKSVVGVMARIDRGACPNCLNPLTSVSTMDRGPSDEVAAFCFNCQRPFTFGTLLVRDKINAFPSSK